MPNSLLVNTNVLVTIAQVLPVFLLAAVFDGLSLPTRFRVTRWLRLTMAALIIFDVVGICALELGVVALIGSGETYSGARAWSILGSLVVVMLFSIGMIVFSVLLWARERALALSSVQVPSRRPALAPSGSRTARQVTALASRRRR